jgi:hypothetical protein
MLLAYQKKFRPHNLATLCNRELPNIEGDQVAQPTADRGEYKNETYLLAIRLHILNT